MIKRIVFAVAALVIGASVMGTSSAFADGHGMKKDMYAGMGYAAFGDRLNGVKINGDGARVFFGWNFHENLSLDGSYSSIGMDKKDSSLYINKSLPTAGGQTYAVDKFKTNNFEVALLIKPKTEQVTPFIRMGYSFLDRQISGQVSSTVDGRRVISSFASKDKTEDFFWGAGVDFGFTEYFGLRLDFALYSGDRSILSMGPYIRF